MRMLALNGSPRGAAGNTERMIQPFLEGARSAGAETEVVYVKDLKIGFCKGCFACWTATPGRCVQRDDMDGVLEKMKTADALLWATPLYHFGMTAMLKAVMERTLPLADPHMIKTGEVYTHPGRAGMNFPEYLVFSNCGFPDSGHFDGLKAHFESIAKASTGRSTIPAVFRSGGELLRQEELQPRIRWYFDALRKAGREYVEHGGISAETMEMLHRDLVPQEMYISQANAHWDSVLKGK
jgi:NAD(P)H-dependent FMN reductase